MDTDALQTSQEALFAMVDERADTFLQWLVELASLPSISATGEGVRDCAEHLVARLTEVGLETELLETASHPIVWGRIGSGDRHVLVYGHYDVVPPGDLTKWPHPPFEPTVEDGSLWGRGVGDSKGQMIAHICALDAWMRVFGTPPPVRLDVMLDGEDEIGSADTSKFIRDHPERFDQDFLYTSDASTIGVWDPALFLGIRGALYVELRVSGARDEWHSGSYGSILPNPVTRLIRAIGTLTDDDNRVLVDGFYDGMEPTTEATVALADALPPTFLPTPEEFGVRAFEREEPVRSMFFEPRICVCGIDGGYTGDGIKMAVPTSARAKLDIALLNGQRPAMVAELLRSHLDRHGFDDVEIHVLADCPPSIISRDHPLVEVATAALADVWGRRPVQFPSIGGGGVFATFVESCGLDCLLVPYAQPDMQEHSAQEHLSIEWFLNGIKTSLEVFRRLALGTGAR